MENDRPVNKIIIKMFCGITMTVFNNHNKFYPDDCNEVRWKYFGETIIKNVYSNKERL